MAQVPGMSRGSASTNSATQAGQDLLDPSQWRKRDAILQKNKVEVRSFIEATDTAKNLILDCIHPTRVEKSVGSRHVSPQDWEEALRILCQMRSYDTKEASQYLQRLIDRCKREDITWTSDKMAWELAFLRIQEYYQRDEEAAAFALRVVEYFLFLELTEPKTPFLYARNGNEEMWDGRHGFATSKGKGMDRPSTRSCNWFSLDNQTLIEVIMLMLIELGDCYDLSTLQIFFRRVVRHFHEHKITRLDPPQFFQEPKFESADEQNWTDFENLKQEPIWAISMPYITTDDFRSLLDRKNKVLDRKYCQTKQKATNHLHSGVNQHMQLTLDEYCKPSLGKALAVRNRDQVLSKQELKDRDEQEMKSEKKPEMKDQEKDECTKGKKREKRSRSGKTKEESLEEEFDRDFAAKNPRLVTIRLAWLWMIDNQVFCAFEDASKRVPKLPGRVPMSNPRDEAAMDFYELRLKIGLLMSDLVNRPNDPQAMKLSESIFDVFESATANLSNDVSRYLKFQDPGHVHVESDKHFEFKRFNVTQEAEFFHNIGDIREELAMLKSVFAQQEDVWKETMRTVFPEHWKEGSLVLPYEREWQHERAVKAFSNRDRDSKKAANHLPGDADEDPVKTRESKLHAAPELGGLKPRRSSSPSPIARTSSTPGNGYSRTDSRPVNTVELSDPVVGTEALSGPGSEHVSHQAAEQGAEYSSQQQSVKVSPLIGPQPAAQPPEQPPRPLSEPGPSRLGREDLPAEVQYAEIWRTIERPQSQFEQYKRRIAQLDDNAARVEASIATVLELRAKHASMQEAHVTAIMSAAVFGFTLVTIIFTPLSFMTSLFALPLQSFQAKQVSSRWGEKNSSGAYRSDYIGGYIGLAEVATLIVTGLASYAIVVFILRGKGTGDMTGWYKKLLNRTKDRGSHASQSENQDQQSAEEQQVIPTTEDEQDQLVVPQQRAVQPHQEQQQQQQQESIQRQRDIPQHQQQYRPLVAQPQMFQPPMAPFPVAQPQGLPAWMQQPQQQYPPQNARYQPDAQKPKSEQQYQPQILQPQMPQPQMLQPYQQQYQPQWQYQSQVSQYPQQVQPQNPQLQYQPQSLFYQMQPRLPPNQQYPQQQTQSEVPQYQQQQHVAEQKRNSFQDLERQ